MRLRLWINWYGLHADGPKGYHMELDRPYDRTPVRGEVIDLPETPEGLAHVEVQGVAWDATTPNLLLGARRESEGASLSSIEGAGFHSADRALGDCEYCARRPYPT